MSPGGKIAILPNLDGAENFSVLVHETAHKLLHRTERRSQTTHTIRETEAEAVSFVVSSALGLDLNSSSSGFRVYQRVMRESFLFHLQARSPGSPRTYISRS